MLYTKKKNSNHIYNKRLVYKVYNSQNWIGWPKLVAHFKTERIWSDTWSKNKMANKPLKTAQHH